MAAETGSGKTGAFCLPVLQIVYETLKDIQSNKGNTIDDKKPNKAFLRFQMNAFDRTPAMGNTRIDG
jgi:ATP-dependent RNA helicase DDX1